MIKKTYTCGYHRQQARFVFKRANAVRSSIQRYKSIWSKEPNWLGWKFRERDALVSFSANLFQIEYFYTLHFCFPLHRVSLEMVLLKTQRFALWRRKLITAGRNVPITPKWRSVIYSKGMYQYLFINAFKSHYELMVIFLLWMFHWLITSRPALSGNIVSPDILVWYFDMIVY